MGWKRSCVRRRVGWREVDWGRKGVERSWLGREESEVERGWLRRKERGVERDWLGRKKGEWREIDWERRRVE